MDIGGVVYSEAFRREFSYENTATSFVSVTLDSPANTVRGTLSAVGLKPNFAYQVKLVGKTPIATAGPPPVEDAGGEAWASWQLGHAGRWCCLDDGSSIFGAQLAEHLDSGRRVTGYLFFDFLITDEHGSATLPIHIDSSFHVLWLGDSGWRMANDIEPRCHDIARDAYGYSGEAVGEGERVSIWAEWERDRSVPGTVALPGGTYSVLLVLTEESFHANSGWPTLDAGQRTRDVSARPEVRYGGSWAQVLEGEVEFEVTGGGS